MLRCETCEYLQRHILIFGRKVDTISANHYSAIFRIGVVIHFFILSEAEALPFNT